MKNPSPWSDTDALPAPIPADSRWSSRSSPSPASPRLDSILERLSVQSSPLRTSAPQEAACAASVQLLPLHVHIAHVDHAFEAQQRKPSLSPLHAARLFSAIIRFLPFTLRQQPLAQRVVDLVRPGMQQVFALEINSCPAQLLSQPLAK